LSAAKACSYIATASAMCVRAATVSTPTRIRQHTSAYVSDVRARRDR
jgi:hypothetical protein